MGLETIEAVGPFGMRAEEPVVHGQQTLELKSRRAALAVGAAADEPGPLQHLEVLGDCRLRQRRAHCELDRSGLAAREALKDRPASGVGKGRESAAQRIVSNHYHQVI